LGHVVGAFPASLQDAGFIGGLNPGLKSGAVKLDAFSIGKDGNVVNGDSNAGLYSDPGLKSSPGLKSGAVKLDAFSIGKDANVVNGARKRGLYTNLDSGMPGGAAAGSWARHG